MPDTTVRPKPVQIVVAPMGDARSRILVLTDDGKIYVSSHGGEDWAEVAGPWTQAVK